MAPRFLQEEKGGTLTLTHLSFPRSALTPETTPSKQYLAASKPGSTFSVPLTVSGTGEIRIYYLRAGGGDFALGSVECWVDDDESHKQRFDGWWDDWRPHIGQFGLVKSGVEVGEHVLRCRLMSETKDPGGGTNFRIISAVSL